MDTINDDYFAQPEYLRIARGEDAPRLRELNDGSGAAAWTEWKKGKAESSIPPEQHFSPAPL